MASSLLLGTSQSLSLSFSRSISAVPLSSRSSAAPASAAAASPAPPLIYCGRGDKKTARGKRFNHSFGNARPRDKKKGRGPPKAPILPSAPKKDPFDDDQVIKIDIDE